MLRIVKSVTRCSRLTSRLRGNREIAREYAEARRPPLMWWRSPHSSRGEILASGVSFIFTVKFRNMWFSIKWKCMSKNYHDDKTINLNKTIKFQVIFRYFKGDPNIKNQIFKILGRFSYFLFVRAVWYKNNIYFGSVCCKSSATQ